MHIKQSMYYLNNPATAFKTDQRELFLTRQVKFKEFRMVYREAKLLHIKNNNMIHLKICVFVGVARALVTCTNLFIFVISKTSR